jgi:hypothetical protein
MISGKGVKNKMTGNRKGNAKKGTTEQSISKHIAPDDMSHPGKREVFIWISMIQSDGH